MPRRPRIHFPGAVYHAMARGVDGRDVFSDERDRLSFLDLLGRLKRETGFSVFAYCLMGNHFHLALRVERTPLSTIMQRLLTAYVAEFNPRHEREGHLFQARYKAILCHDDAYLLSLIRYIHLNPVRAGLCDSPGQWPWSSWREMAVGGAGLIDRTRLQRIVPTALEDMGSGVAPGFEPWPEGANSARPPDQDDAAPALEIFAASVIPAGLIDAVRSSDRRVSTVAERRRFSAEAVKAGYSLTQIGRWLGCTRAAVHHLLRRGSKQVPA